MKIIQSLTVYILIAFVLVKTAAAQDTNDARKLLNTVSEKLLSFQSIRYHYTREMNYVSDNYFSKAEADCYFEFKGKQVTRFQLVSTGSTQTFNGKDYFSLNHNNNTYQLTENVKQGVFSSFSYLYNALPAMRSVLEDIVRNDSVSIQKGDTVIANRQFPWLRLTMKNRSIDYLGSVMRFTESVTIYYTLVIDPDSFLPVYILQRNDRRPDDYTKITYSAVDINAQQPQADSWELASYTNRYSLPVIKEKEIPLVTIGSVLGQWQLPEFDGKQNNRIYKGQDRSGKLVLLDFWIKNCGYCMESFVHLKDLQRKYGSFIDIITINTLDPVSDVAFFHKREKPRYKMLYKGKELSRKLGIESRGYPTVVMMGKDGKVIYAGDFAMEKIEKLIEKNL